MKFKKGVSGNPKGRPKGKYTKPIKTKLEGLLCRAFPLIEQEFDTGSPEIKRELFIGLAGIVLPQKTKTA